MDSLQEVPQEVPDVIPPGARDWFRMLGDKGKATVLKRYEEQAEDERRAAIVAESLQTSTSNLPTQSIWDKIDAEQASKKRETSASERDQPDEVDIKSENASSAAIAKSAPIPTKVAQATAEPTQAQARPAQAEARPTQAQARPLQAETRPAQAPARPSHALPTTVAAANESEESGEVVSPDTNSEIESRASSEEPFAHPDNRKRSIEHRFAGFPKKLKTSVPASPDTEATTPLAPDATTSSITALPERTSSNIHDRRPSAFSGRMASTTGGYKIPKSISSLAGIKNSPDSTKLSSTSTNAPRAEASSSAVVNNLPASSQSDDFSLPDWYRGVDLSAQLDREARSKLTRLQQLATLRKKLPRAQGQEREELWNKIRRDLHWMEHQLVDHVLVKRSRLLDRSDGLPQLFVAKPNEEPFPYDIVADARALFNKWRRADFDPDILRGVKYGKKSKKSNTPPSEGVATAEEGRKAWSLDVNYPNRISGNYSGEGDLVVGQWWPILYAAMRDGAHGAGQAGIHGSVNHGAYSVLVSGSDYDDLDEGDLLHYCGTEGTPEGMTAATKLLHDNIRTKEPVRVLRTAGLKPSNPYRPSHGYRYDGLYDVVEAEMINAAKCHYRFLLRRQPGQAPIRYQGVYARPSVEDVEAFNNHRGLYK